MPKNGFKNFNFMKKNWFKNIKRFRGDTFDRSKYLRLDKNERVIEFEKEFINYIKKNLKSHLFSSYPYIDEVYNLISKKLKISKNMICITAGSDLAIKSCFEYFTGNESKIITLSPTFGMVDVYSKIYNVKNIQIGYDKHLTLNVKKLLSNIKKDVSLIIIANPNSPTGTKIEKKDLIKILNKSKKAKIPVVVDEAYYGFHKESCIKLIKNYNNLIITRSFSKVYGLAGLRAGFLVANQKITRNLFKLKPMYEINSISCLAIKFILKNLKIIKNHIKNIEDGKKYLIKELSLLQKDYIACETNFFHINLGKKRKVFENILRKNRILTRKGPGVKGFENYLRVTLGSKLQMKKIINLLKKIN